MLKKIILTIFILFITLSPISANTTIHPNAYIFPWNTTHNYVVFNSGQHLQALVTRSSIYFHNSTLWAINPNQFANNIIQKFRFNTTTNTWTNITSSIFPVSSPGVSLWTTMPYDGSPLIPITNILGSNTNILAPNNTILFRNAPFRLATLAEQREGATLEGLNLLMFRISRDLLQILPIGLLALSSLLAIPLLKRLRGLIGL